jgi:hypothetical protein
MSTKEMIAVMQAFDDGKVIQFKGDLGTWQDCNPSWNWSEYEYRVKPEPREWWIVSWSVFSNRNDAEEYVACRTEPKEIIRVREVLP